jgi:hypothetical protein
MVQLSRVAKENIALNKLSAAIDIAQGDLLHGTKGTGGCYCGQYHCRYYHYAFAGYSREIKAYGQNSWPAVLLMIDWLT